jgi:hypothetical protein
MEYLIGSFLTIIGISVLNYTYRFFNSDIRPIGLQVSQSRTHSLMAPSVIFIGNRYKHVETQSLNHLESIKVKILMTERNAYWIKDNTVYVAEMQDGAILEETTKVVDMMGMDKVQLNEMMFIIEKLTEGKSNDRWSSGDSHF